MIRRLLDAVLASPEALVARSLSCFVYPNGRGTASALERQRFSLRESLYLTRDLADRRAGPGKRSGCAAGPAGTSPARCAS